MKVPEYLKPIGASLIVFFVCLVLSNEAAGGGHGNDVVFGFFFPYTTLCDFFLPKLFAQLVPILAFVVQFPLYAVVLSAARKHGNLANATATLAAAHIASFVLVLIYV